MIVLTVHVRMCKEIPGVTLRYVAKQANFVRSSDDILALHLITESKYVQV